MTEMITQLIIATKFMRCYRRWRNGSDLHKPIKLITKQPLLPHQNHLPEHELPHYLHWLKRLGEKTLEATEAKVYDKAVEIICKLFLIIIVLGVCCAVMIGLFIWAINRINL